MFAVFPRKTHIAFDKDHEDFRYFAIACHANQLYDDKPYALHLASVEDILVNVGFTDYEYRAAAWLHDIVEDTKVTYEQVFKNYGPTVASMVWGCTGEGANRKERNQSIYTKLKECPLGAPVKVADRYANMRYGIANKSQQAIMYLKEFNDFSTNIRPLIADSVNGLILWNKLEELVSNNFKLVG